MPQNYLISWVNQQFTDERLVTGQKNLSKRAVKTLKSLVQVNLCAEQAERKML